MSSFTSTKRKRKYPLIVRRTLLALCIIFNEFITQSLTKRRNTWSMTTKTHIITGYLFRPPVGTYSFHLSEIRSHGQHYKQGVTWLDLYFKITLITLRTWMRVVTRRPYKTCVSDWGKCWCYHGLSSRQGMKMENMWTHFLCALEMEERNSNGFKVG